MGLKEVQIIEKLSDTGMKRYPVESGEIKSEN